MNGGTYLCDGVSYEFAGLKTMFCYLLYARYVRDSYIQDTYYRDWETDRKSTRLNSSHITRSRMPSSA